MLIYCNKIDVKIEKPKIQQHLKIVETWTLMFLKKLLKWH